MRMILAGPERMALAKHVPTKFFPLPRVRVLQRPGGDQVHIKKKRNEKNKEERLMMMKECSKGDIKLKSDDKSSWPAKNNKNRVYIIVNKDRGSYLGSVLTSSLKSNQVEIDTDSRTQKTVARLREPRDLFTLPREPQCSQEAARWPSECQVIEQKMQHIDAMPSYNERYYDLTGKEIQPKPAADTDGSVVYSYSPMSAVNYFSRSTSRCSAVSPQPNRPQDLRFESRFESGNLSKAIKITDNYYQLYLRTDLYTNRHCQWFYFMIENMTKGVQYRFSIVNLCKGESLYSVGMKPVMYSTKAAVDRKLGWHRCGTNITYFRNDNGTDEEDPESTYTLTFQLDFPYDEDCCFLAHSYPYTYTNLQDYLYKLQNHPIKSLHTRLRLLCKTLAGNNVYYLTVTAPPSSDETLKKKKAVVITARVHPGESPASFMMKGLIDFITGETKAAQELRQRFIFKLVPMLNPDGVIVGNSRCSLTGRDLNRQFRTVIRETYPPVWHTKVLIKRLMEDCGIALYCDLHAHSSKHNVFIYGCENKRNPDRRLQEQVFPLMLHKNSSDKFSFENCKFRIQKNKEGTGRVVMWMLGIENSYTLEASFAGSTLGMRSCTHFTTTDYEAMGKSFCETLLDFLDDTPVKLLKYFSTSQLKLRTKILLKLQKEGSSADEPANVSVSDYSSDDGQISDSSDEEKRKREDCFLTAPPPSPETVCEKSRSVKEGSPKPHRHPPPIIFSPPAQRKALQISTATIDLDRTELHERTRMSPQRTKAEQSQKCPTIRVDNIDMPPELLITSTQGNDLSVFERLYKSAQLPKEISKSPSRRDSCRRCSPGRYDKKTYSPNLSDPEMRARYESAFPYKQQFWRVVTHGSMSNNANNPSQDQLLKACSDKLTELKKKHKLKKIKYSENAVLSVPKLFFASRRLKRKARSFNAGKNPNPKLEQTHNINNDGEELIKKKTQGKGHQLDEIKKEAAFKPRKFRKGGIVSLATVHKQNLEVADTINNDNSLENVLGKKKKKRKKLSQLQRRVKNAVSIVAMTNKKLERSMSSRKSSSGS